MIRHLPLGNADYRDTLALQRLLHTMRCAGEIPDLVISVEHNPVFTIGRTGSRDNLLVSETLLLQEGIDMVDVERGGDITYHGPGQLVLYPIFDLRGFGKDIHRFIWLLEEAIIRTLLELGIDGGRRSGFPGVWVAQRKNASIGVYVKNWVTYHGLALNVDVSQRHFQMIRPCGLSVEMVSVNDLVDSPLAISDVCEILLDAWQDLLDEPIALTDHKELNIPNDHSSIVD